MGSLFSVSSLSVFQNSAVNFAEKEIMTEVPFDVFLIIIWISDCQHSFYKQRWNQLRNLSGARPQ